MGLVYRFGLSAEVRTGVCVCDGVKERDLYLSKLSIQVATATFYKSVPFFSPSPTSLTQEAVWTLIYEYRIMRYNNIASVLYNVL